MLIAQIVSAGITIYFSKKYFKLPLGPFLLFLLEAVVTFLGAYYVGHYIDGLINHQTNDIIRLIIVSVISDLFFVAVYCIFCFSKQEKKMIISLTNNLLKKLHIK